MKLLTFAKDGLPRVGVYTDEGVVDLTGALHLTHPDLGAGPTMLDIIRSGIDIDDIAEASLARLRSEDRLAALVVASPTYLPPIMDPPKILALALNCQGHIDETNLKFFDEPIIFAKYASNMIGHESEIELPPFPQKVDEEIELGLIVGRDCRHISPSQAPDYIFGWTICNDVSARQRQRERGQMNQPYSYAKNFATFAPIGPWIVTRKELPDASDLAMEVRIDGKVRRSGRSSEYIFDPYTVLAYCSDYTPMQAGDIISLGTFAGDKQIREGEMVELEIEKIGILRNKVVASKAAWSNFAVDTPTGPLVKEGPKDAAAAAAAVAPADGVSAQV